ncbi:hypothetical protein RALTA_B1634 [Cupriavidus taiwanensis LMG 19424]|uniref:Uncharacterized protein n=1 Tax=Cupriavidus taiwanensis (strain DSM 17343 / BCRC 17206 / CCUG 44338 / CIP 107171 / LMG 19424 / R1) TaxID=977880 RepID=B3RBF4_CUPTR|nr:hypothetical protein RALTA_B1634 [Cupriavidus taiwanensis LMG 19424]
MVARKILPSPQTARSLVQPSLHAIAEYANAASAAGPLTCSTSTAMRIIFIHAMCSPLEALPRTVCTATPHHHVAGAGTWTG